MSKHLVTRRPPTLQYILMTPAAGSREIVWETEHGAVAWPRLDSRKLPPRIDQVACTYGELRPFPQEHPDAYTIGAMEPAIANACANGGVLGAYCNALMVWSSVFGSAPRALPARLEDVIDGSVKAPVDLAPVLAWIGLTMQEIVAEGREIPAELTDRITMSLCPEDRAALLFADNHWFSNLLQATDRHIESFTADAAALMAGCRPPQAIFEHGYHWINAGSGLVTRFQAGLRDGSLQQANRNALNFLEAAPDPDGVLLGAAAHIYMTGLSDAVLWQLDPEDDTPGTARRWLAALRRSGVIGEPVWTTIGAVVHYNEQPTGVPLQINGPWFNYLNALRERNGRSRYTVMGQTPRAERESAKALIAQAVASGRFTSMLLETDVTADNRITVHGPNGGLLGYIAKGQELRAATSPKWRIQYATCRDGNLHVVAARA